jgi:hypothetical protein
MPERKNENDYFNAEAYYAKLKDDAFKNIYNKGINNLLIQQSLDRPLYLLPSARMSGGSQNRVSGIALPSDFLPGSYDRPEISLAVTGAGKKKNKSSLSSAKAWTKYASGTADDILNKAEKAKSLSGGKKKNKSSLSSVKAWTKYASDTTDDILNKAEKAKSLSGGKKKNKSSLSSVKAWTKYASGTADDILNKAEKAKSLSGGSGTLKWIPYVKKYAAEKGISYSESLSRAGESYRNQ